MLPYPYIVLKIECITNLPIIFVHGFYGRINSPAIDVRTSLESIAGEFIRPSSKKKTICYTLFFKILLSILKAVTSILKAVTFIF